jgi:hypothetical protein
MKIKTSELTGAALDWAVAACEEKIEKRRDNLYRFPFLVSHAKYSTDWALGGPIIEREWLDITPWPNESDEGLRWQCIQHDNIDCTAFGLTPLVAAMRCLVASKLGAEVDTPDELVLPGADAA